MKIKSLVFIYCCLVAIVGATPSTELTPARIFSSHTAGLLKHDNYKLIQMVEHPSFFAENPEAQEIIRSMDGVTYEAHRMNRHWPLETGWSRLGPVVRGARWTLDQSIDYIFYYGPLRFKENDDYREFFEREWLQEFWQAGLPKRHPKMHYFLNAFPHEGSKRPVGPESAPHSNLGLTKWLIGELQGEKQEAKATSISPPDSAGTMHLNH